MKIAYIITSLNGCFLDHASRRTDGWTSPNVAQILGTKPITFSSEKAAKSFAIQRWGSLEKVRIVQARRAA